MRKDKAKLVFMAAVACAVLVSGCRGSSDRTEVAGTAGNGGSSASSSTKFGCGTKDTPETGIQGDIPRADLDSGRAEAGYNCGLSLVGEIPFSSGALAGGAVQAFDHCAYIRTSASNIDVYDLRDPLAPKQLASISPKGSKGGGGTSETMRIVTTPSRALLASGSSIYDIRNCEKPVHKGDITWPGILPWPAGLSHDIRISHDGTKVYAGIGVVVADITKLDHPETWTVVNQTCAVAAQYHPLHALPGVFDLSLCLVSEDQAPQLSHGPDDNGAGTRLYIGNQGIPASVWIEMDTMRILDLTVDPPKILDSAPGPGHSVDWFRTADGREYILHANEIVAVAGASCVPHPRPSNLGFAFEAFITEVTGDKLVRRSMLELDINKAENCAAKLASGQSTSIAYHSIDNPDRATFAMVSFGDSVLPSVNSVSGAGLRLFDIRDPSTPKEVAYFNRGSLRHASVTHYDPSNGLLYVPASSALQILELQPQVIKGLGLKYPTDPAYPRYPNGRAATPG